MSDVDRSAMEAEAPVNPYSLLEAVNATADRTHMSWLIFIGLMIYILIAVAGVTHQDLLLNSKISLPMVQVQVELTQFFLFAPMVLVVIHLGAIMQLVMLSRKTIEFDKAMRLLEVSDRRAHPLRLELHNFFFVQAIAGPSRSRILGLCLHLMTWLTLVILPVLLLLFIQTSFIPYHDETVTWLHRIVLQIDIAMLVLIGVFLVRSETSFFKAFMRSAMQNPLSFLCSTIVFAYVTFFSFFVATIPDKVLANFAEKYGLVVYQKGKAQSQQTQLSFAIPSVGAAGAAALFWRFHRNLVVTGADIVKDKNITASDRTIDLRGRDLRHAVLDRTDLHQADLTDAKLEYATLNGADLRGVDLRQANLDNASLVGAKMQGVLMHCRDVSTLIFGSGSRQQAGCAVARNADFSHAQFAGANLLGLDLENAKFVGATLTGADLSLALMAGANFNGAHLERVSMADGVTLQGANFQLASLQGANLNGANLLGANLNAASLQGAILRWAVLDGANLSDAKLQGADLFGASLFAANLEKARLFGADLKQAKLWVTAAPGMEGVKLTAMAGATLVPPDRAALQTIRTQLQSIADKKLRAKVRQTLQPVFDRQNSDKWAGSDARRVWDSLLFRQPASVDPSITYKGQVTSYLGNLMCNNPWSPGAVATGIVRQAINLANFRGDGAVIDQLLKAGNCANGKGVAEKLVVELTTTVNAASQ